MALEDMEKKYRISDIARELQVSPQEVLLFVKQEGGRVASTSSMVGEEIHGLIFGHFSVEKKMVDETKKIRAEKEKRLSRLEEQSRKTYEKEQHLSETLSPPAPPLVVVHEPKKEVIVAAPIENIAEPPSRPLEIPVAESPASEEPDAPPAVTELIEQPLSPLRDSLLRALAQIHLSGHQPAPENSFYDSSCACQPACQEYQVP